VNEAYEECKLRVFENRILRIFGPGTNDLTEGWRKLHNEELHSLYSSANIISVFKSRRMSWIGNAAHMGEIRTHISYDKPEGNRPLDKGGHRWVNNVNNGF
jgi:hypothetical protein